MKRPYTRCKNLPKGESLLWNAWSYLVSDEDRLESEWEAEEVLKELLHTFQM